jgi:DNA modification methylase
MAQTVSTIRANDTRHMFTCADFARLDPMYRDTIYPGLSRPEFNAHLFSNPYPGVGEAPYRNHEEYVDWLYERRGAILGTLAPNGVIIHNIWYPKRLKETVGERKGESVYIDPGVFRWPDIWMGWDMTLNLHGFFVWDTVNPPPRGNMKRRPRDRVELVWVMARPGFQYRPWLEPYAEKTVEKAATGNMRQADIRGNMVKGNTAPPKLNPRGAIATNLISISTTGDQRKKGEKAEQGSFPIELAIQLLYQYTVPGNYVCDVNCGGGSTNVAAAYLGLNSVGIDISPTELAKAIIKMEKFDEERPVFYIPKD